ncbi:transcriptional regulator GcvA [Denitromonas iodatirespirans]|uniref:Transcriptional regulator GcvA n=1 Tax=Denitromonas iodatirespirans TaxID=2795389 RepID=A0A944HB20_DENI1|nr:transcriptional regulator GcvA [Denitromonas iodatirespirans]MBT0961207.1 transcriptional regulator GcvA [Denitromonas iodatirespirans]
MPRIPPLSALRAFEAVARLGSVVKAAAELHLTHSAISHQLRALEDTLGQQLFDRRGKRLAVNENGRVYAMQVRYALSDLSRATGSFLAQSRDDELVIGTIPSFGAHWLVPRLPHFTSAYPDLKLSVRAGLRVADLDAEGIDVAIRMGHGGWDKVQQRELFADRLVAVAAPHFRGGRLPRTPAEVVAAPLLLSVENWRPWQEAAGLPADDLHGMHFNDSNLVLEAARRGQGVALSRLSLVHGALQDGQLVQLTDISVPYTTPYWLVWPVRSAGRASVAQFSQWLDAEIDAYLANVSAGIAGGVSDV